MSEELVGVVVCHGSLASALVQAAEQISGVQTTYTVNATTGAPTVALPRFTGASICRKLS